MLYDCTRLAKYNAIADCWPSTRAMWHRLDIVLGPRRLDCALDGETSANSLDREAWKYSKLTYGYYCDIHKHRRSERFRVIISCTCQQITSALNRLNGEPSNVLQLVEFYTVRWNDNPWSVNCHRFLGNFTLKEHPSSALNTNCLVEMFQLEPRPAYARMIRNGTCLGPRVFWDLATK